MQKKSIQQAGGRGTGVRKVRIDADTAGQRLDNFLRRQLPGVPKGRLYRLLRRGEVRVNGGRARAGLSVSTGAPQFPCRANSAQPIRVRPR